MKGHMRTRSLLLVLSLAMLSACLQGQTITVLHEFADSEGTYALPGLAEASDGNFYGATEYGGSTFGGTLFGISPSGAFALLRSFDLSGLGNGFGASVIQGGDGFIYGANVFGGDASGSGTVFRIALSGDYQQLHAFTGGPGGAEPMAPLVEGTDGAFYGTTAYGGDASNSGTIFRVTSAGDFQQLHAFTGGPGGAE